MEPLNLAALKARNTVRKARKAVLSPGPWTQAGPRILSPAGAGPVADVPQPGDRLFLVGARNDPVEADVDALIRRVEELEATAAGGSP